MGLLGRGEGGLLFGARFLLVFLLPFRGRHAIDKGARRVSLSVKALEMAEEQEAIEQFGSQDSGASLGDILGAALREKAKQE